MATQESRNIIQQMYVGYYGRPADDTGLTFWADELESNGGDLSAIANAFGTSAEYTALSEGKTPEELVNMIFQNLFNRDAEGTVGDTTTGLGFFVDKLTSGEMTTVTIAQNIIDGAQGDDITAIANKNEVANHFTATVVSEGKEYGENEIDEGQTVINGVTADAATITTGKTAADTAIGDFPAIEATPLGVRIAALKTAEDAKATFLVTADGDDDPETSADEAAVATGLTDATTAVDDLVEGDYSGGSTTVREALLADQEADNAADLTTANTAKTAAQAEIDDASGLEQAVTDLNAAKDASDAATADLLVKTAALDGAKANYDTLNSATVTVDVDGTAVDGGTDLIVLDGDDLVLATDITEQSNPGVTTLLDASIGLEAAEIAAEDAATAATAAQFAVNSLDLTDDAKTELAAVGAGMTATTPVDADAPTSEEIEAEVTTLTDGIAALSAAIGELGFASDEATTEAAHAALTTTAESDGLITTADKAAIDSAFNDVQGADGNTVAAAITASQGALDTNNLLDDFNGLVATFNTAAETNSRLDGLDTAEAGVATAQTTIDTLAEALAAQAAAQAAVDELATLNANIDAAEQDFTDNDQAVPVTLAVGANTATDASDIFKLGDKEDSSIADFNVSGSDVLFIGSKFALNEGDVATEGDDTVLEVFLTESAGNTVVTLEESVFGSSAQVPELFEVTLTGIALADVTLAEGLITVA